MPSMRVSPAPDGVYAGEGASLRGFTLIELLVVISIISLLAGILLPSLGKARALGRSTACKGNLHAAGTAFRMYLNDSNDVMPYAAALGGEKENPQNKPLLVDVLGVCLSAPEVLLCPDDTDQHYFLNHGSSYVYNIGLHNYGKPYTEYDRIKQWGEDQVEVLNDAKPRAHLGKNYLYADLHVTD